MVLEKSLFSSPAACRQTIEQRLKKITGIATPEAKRDRDTLQALADAVEAITPDQFTKYQRLLTLLRKGGDLDWHPELSSDRLVIFTERVETLKFLREHLEKDLKLKPAQIATLHGQESGDQQLQDTVKEFGRDKEAVRLLIAPVTAWKACENSRSLPSIPTAAATVTSSTRQSRPCSSSSTADSRPRNR